jgi:catechol-2,3-dioxygenase
MAKIRHIALTTANPSAVAEFYKEAFEMEEVRRSENGAVFLSDGYINLAILNHKTAAKDADVGPNGDNYDGIHHIGFLVDDLDAACEKLDAAKGKSITSREGLDAAMNAPGAPRNFEMKWSGPDDVVIDISHTGWITST